MAEMKCQVIRDTRKNYPVFKNCQRGYPPFQIQRNHYFLVLSNVLFSHPSLFFFKCLSSQCILMWAKVAKEGVLRVRTTMDACHVSPGSFLFWRGLAWNRSEYVFPRVQVDTMGHGTPTLINVQVSAGASAWICLFSLEGCVPVGVNSTEKQMGQAVSLFVQFFYSSARSQSEKPWNGLKLCRNDLSRSQAMVSSSKPPCKMEAPVGTRHCPPAARRSGDSSKDYGAEGHWISGAGVL